MTTLRQPLAKYLETIDGGTDPSVVIPTAEGARHGFDVTLSRPQLKQLSEDLERQGLARIEMGETSPGEQVLLADDDAF